MLLKNLTNVDLSSNQLTGALPLGFAVLGTQIDQYDLSMNTGFAYLIAVHTLN